MTRREAVPPRLPATAVECGATNSLADVGGMRVGHATRRGDGWLTGVTVVLAPEGGMAAGVDVRGGVPGTRETDLLDPGATVQRVHAITLTGGSAYGLSAASGVADELGAAGVGLPVGAQPREVVPIVPSGVVFDLGRGGDFGSRPGPDDGVAAVRDARAGSPACGPGALGAGTGALAGGFKGGVGTASSRLRGGATVAALVVLNAAGSVVDGRTGELLGTRSLIDGDPTPGVPDPDEWRAWCDAAAEATVPFSPAQNTTLAVLSTDVALSKAACRRVAGAGHDGLARAIDPVHTAFDGDTVFATSTCERPSPSDADYYELCASAAACVSRAVVHAVLAAESVATPAGRWTSYSDALPSATGQG
jgi:putative pantetheine hydrolase